MSTQVSRRKFIGASSGLAIAFAFGPALTRAASGKPKDANDGLVRVDHLAPGTAIDMDRNESLVGGLMPGIQLVYGCCGLSQPGRLVKRNRFVGIRYLVTIQFQNGGVPNTVVGVLNQHKHLSPFLLQ